MSLLRLLTTGKSLVEFKDTPGAYRLTSQRLLPRFGAARNPFCSNVKPNAVPGADPALGDAGDTDASGERCRVPSSGGNSTVAAQSGATDRKASATASGHGLPEALRLKAASLVKACGARFKGLLGHACGKAAKPAIPRFTKPPVQGELSLEKVRVVRNDLSDADLEVGPAKRSATRESSTSALQSEATTRVVGGRWGRVADRIFGASKT